MPELIGLPAPLRADGSTFGAQVAVEIERDILARRLPTGHLLGSESELTARFGVGVAAIREASRILAARGLARSRRGPGGGLFVTVPDRGIVTDAARLYLEHAGVDRVELFEVWLALEQLAVTKLCASIDPAGALALRSALPAPGAAASTRSWTEIPNIHLEIARQAGNPALALFIETLTELSLSLYGPTTDPRHAGDWLRDRHAEIVEAVIAGDAPMAQLHLRRYIEALQHPPREDTHV